MKTHIFLSCIVVLFMASCKHKIDFADSPEVKFSSDISPIIIGNCTQSSCHGSIDTEEFELLTYNQVIEHVEKGKPDKSELYQVITSYSDERMPLPPLPALTDDQIKLIYVWIGQGAKNN
jgi:hypothetical protein